VEEKVIISPADDRLSTGTFVHITGTNRDMGRLAFWKSDLMRAGLLKEYPIFSERGMLKLSWLVNVKVVSSFTMGIANAQRERRVGLAPSSSRPGEVDVSRHKLEPT